MIGDISAILYEIVLFIARVAIWLGVWIVVFAFLVMSFTCVCDIYDKIKKSNGGKRK